MSNQSWQQTLAFAPIAGTTLVSSAAATSIIPPAARCALNPPYFSIGTLLRIKASGVISTLTAAPGTLTFAVNLGTIAVPIIAWTSGAIALNVTAQTNAAWLLEILLTCRAVGVGTNSNLIGQGELKTRALLGAPAVGTTQGVGVAPLPDTAPVVGTGFDSTLQQTVDLFATWSISNAANSLTLYQYTLESLN